MDYNEWLDSNPIRAWRKQNGVSVHRFAAEVGVSPTAVNSWERGAFMPQTESLIKIARLLGFSIESLIAKMAAWKSLL